MTAPLTTLRAKLTPSEPHRYLLDDAAEWLMKSRNRESVGLVVLAGACVALIFVVRHA